MLGNIENMFGLGKMTNNAKGSIWTEAMDLCTQLEKITSRTFFTKLEKITNRTFVINWKMQYLKNVITRKKERKKEEESKN